jgi:hypothetical protein
MMQGSSREFRPDLAREFEYLLGHMPRVDRETFQGLLIENSEASDRVLEAENELFDAYLRGDLPGEWRPAFESRLLSTERGRDKLAAARKLSQKLRRSRRSLWWSSAIAAGIALIAGFWPSVTGNRDADRSSKTTPSVIAQVIPQQLELKAITRGDAAAGRPRFSREPAATHFVLALPDAGATSVEVSRLGTAGGDVAIWKSTSAPPFQVPADLLTEGAYLVTSFTNGTISNYYEFEIVRK